MKKKDLILSYMQRTVSIADKEKFFTTQELVDHFHMQRTNISSILNQLVKDNKLEKIDGRPVLYRLINLNQSNEKYDLVFQKMIGCNDSLKNAIKKVKSELIYPDKKHMFLFIGSSGVGKSFFVQTLFEYVKERKMVSKKAQLLKLNCKYYMNHENDLIDVIKSAALLKQVEDGIMFVDNVHLISRDKRAIIYDLITLQSKEGHFILVFSSDKNVDEDFRKNYLECMNVIIDIPDLMDRSLNERFDIMKNTLQKESQKIDKNFIIDAEVLLCLLLYHCERNIKQFINDIKEGCASAYLREIDYNNENIHLYLYDFPKYVKKGSIFYKSHAAELSEFVSYDYVYCFTKESVEKTKDDFLLEKHQDKYSYLKDMTFNEKSFQNSKINVFLNKYNKEIKSKNIDETSLSKIVNNEIIQLVKDFLDYASRKLNHFFPDSVFYGLCLHLQSLVEHPEVRSYSDDYIEQTIKENQKEYVLSLQLLDTIEEQLNVHIELEEASLITMFICEKNQAIEDDGFPVFLIAMHGSQTASSLVDVVKTLVKTDKVYAFNLSLDKEIIDAYNELKNFIKQINMGKGILMMYDMGSLKTMAQEIADETGINIQFIISPTTLIALECARKMETIHDLDSIVLSMKDSYEKYFPSIVDNYEREIKKDIIITLCMTGEGGALQIKRYLEKIIEFRDIDIIPLSMKDKNQLISQINHLKEEHNILYVIGTFNPHLHGVSFISISQLFNTPIEQLSELFSVNGKFLPTKKRIKYSLIFKNIEEQMPDFDIDLLKENLIQAIHKIDVKYPLNQNKRIGLIMHISHLIYQLVHQQNIKQIRDYNKIIMANKKIYNYLCDVFSDIEKVFEIKFPDSDIAMIIKMIKEI